MLNPIRSLVCEHYAMPTMPMRVMTREEDILAYELEHPEVPHMLWKSVDHNIRLMREWRRATHCVDLVVEVNGEYRMVQDICFIDAYTNADAWSHGVLALIRSSQPVWVVRHDE